MRRSDKCAEIRKGGNLSKGGKSEVVSLTHRLLFLLFLRGVEMQVMLTEEVADGVNNEAKQVPTSGSPLMSTMMMG